MSNVGKWDVWYRGVADRGPYGDTDSYRIGADFLQDCDTAEDWGCGRGWFATLRTGHLVGVDGSHSPFADIVTDLETYTSSVDGIFLRHVLEHNRGWRHILRNALQSFRRKMVLVVFTPWSDGETHELRVVEPIGVPEIAFRKDDIVGMLRGLTWESQELRSPDTIYGLEHVFLIERPPPA